MSLYDELEKIEKEQAGQESSDGKPQEKVNLKSSESKPDSAPLENGSDDSEGSGEKADGKNKEKSNKDDSDENSKTGTDDKKEKTPQEEKIDHAAFAQLRRDKAAAERRAKALEDQIKQQASVAPRAPESIKAPAGADMEPDPNIDPEAHLRWKLSKTEAQLEDISKWKERVDKQENDKRLRDNAVEAYTKYENDFSPTVKDYKEVTRFGLNQIEFSIRTLNPRLQGEALQEAVRMQVFRIAAEAEKQGHDPAEYFYHTARSLGYQEPQETPTPAIKTEEKPRPNLKNVVDHKRRTAGALAHGGKSGNNSVSREALPGMAFSEFARLTPQQLRDLEA